jgi:peptidoglycan hydrolase-like protein with peptidoglycan-binding domain
MSGNQESEAASRNPVLKPWDVCPAVAEMQELLNAHGFRLRVDGNYGWITELAVQEFQRQHGLRIDGVVGSKTWALLKQDLKPGARVLRQGCSGTDVRELQGLLQVQGYGLDRHGIFCERTKLAVINFQQKHHLKEDGVVDSITWTALRGGAPLPSKPDQTRWFIDPRKWW